MSDDKQTCFGCQHSLNFGTPNISSKRCMDKCRRGSEFKPFNGQADAEELIEEGKTLDKMVGFVIGTGFCMGESKYETCIDCYSMQECQQMLMDDDMSLNPKTQGSTLEPEDTVYRGFGIDNPEKLTPGSIVDLGAHHPVNYRVVEEYDHSKEARPWPTGPIVKRNGIDIEAMNKANEMADNLKAAIRSTTEEPIVKEDNGNMRSFESGATRDTADGKLAYDKFLSPGAIKQFAKYMNMNRLQSDGNLRAGDNWQKGIPMEAYVESESRHHHEAWEFFRQIKHRDRDGMVEGIGALCGILFNIMGYLHEWLKVNEMIDFDGDEPTFEMKERRDAIESNEETEGS